MKCTELENDSSLHYCSLLQIALCFPEAAWERGLLCLPCIYTNVCTYTHVDALIPYCTTDDGGVKLIISGSTSGFHYVLDTAANLGIQR